MSARVAALLAVTAALAAGAALPVTAGAAGAAPAAVAASPSPSASPSAGAASPSAGAASPSAGAATTAADVVQVALAGPLQPPAPSARTVGPLTVPLRVTNTGTEVLHDVAVTAVRGAPVTTRTGLADAFRGTAVGADGFGVRVVRPAVRLPDPLAPGASTTVDVVTDTGAEPAGVCLCYLGVYALDLDVTAARTEGGRTGPVGRLQTYLSSVGDEQAADARVRVGWVWSLLERPHRRTDGTEFVDDALAAAVRPGGRLDRALATVEQVDAADPARPAGSVGLTLVLDPETLGELVALTTGYTVPGPGGTRVAGTGGPAAAAWLARLRAVAPRHDVVLTAAADPDVDALATAGLPVHATLPGADAAAVAAALGSGPGGPPVTPVPGRWVWPVDGALTAAGSATARAGGATAALVATPGGGTDPAVGVARARDGLPLLLTPADVDAQAAQTVSVRTSAPDAAAAEQRLLATLALRAVEDPVGSPPVAVVPGRYPDVVPDAAARAVLVTAAPDWATPQSPAAQLAAAAAGGSAGTAVDLTRTAATAPGLPADQLDAAPGLAAAADAVRTAVRAAGADPEPVVGDVAGRVQRAAASAWAGDRGDGSAAARALQDRLTGLDAAVRVVADPSTRYNLASSDSPLLITVANDLPVPVRVRVTVTPVGSVAGLRSQARPAELVPAGARPTLRVPTTVARSGRFRVTVAVVTPAGTTLGTPVVVTVRSTAVGAVGRTMTLAAGVLLILALVTRAVRRLAARRRAGSGPDRPARPRTGAAAGAQPDDPETTDAVTSTR